MSGNLWRRGAHLAVGALLVAGYYAGLPEHLWDAPEGFQPSPGGMEVATPAWSITELAASPELADAQLMARGNRLVAFWREGPSLRLARTGDGEASWTTETLSEVNAGRRGLLQAVMVSGWEEPAILLRRRTGVGQQWHLLRDGRERPLPLASVPGVNWHAGPAVALADGGTGLPLHAPGTGRMALLRLGPDGDVRGLHPAGPSRAGRSAPGLLVENRAEALLLTGPGARSRATANGGIDWRPLEMDLPDEVSDGFTPVRRGAGWWWLLSVTQRDGREILRVQESRDGGAGWRERETAALETGQSGNCAGSLPAARHTRDGRLHLLHVTGDCRLLHARLVAGEAQ